MAELKLIVYICHALTVLWIIPISWSHLYEFCMIFVYNYIKQISPYNQQRPMNTAKWGRLGGAGSLPMSWFVPTSTPSRGCHNASSGGRGLQSENYSKRPDSGNHLALGDPGSYRVPQEVCLDGLKDGKGEKVSRSLTGSSVVMSQPGIQLTDLSLFNKQMLSRPAVYQALC